MKLTKAQLAAFARDVLRSLWDGCDLDGADLQALAEKHRLIRCVPFDPDKHSDHLGVCPCPGDDWYVQHPQLAKLAGRAALSADGGER